MYPLNKSRMFPDSTRIVVNALHCIIIIMCHHNRSAVMDLHRSWSCATLIQSLYNIFVNSLMLSVHIVLSLPRPLLSFILPSIIYVVYSDDFISFRSIKECQQKENVICIRITSLNKSINQISITPIPPAKPDSVLQQPKWCSTAKSMKQFHKINRPSGIIVSTGERPSPKRCVWRCFLKIATEIAGQTDRRSLFQREGAQEWNAFAPVLVLTLETN